MVFGYEFCIFFLMLIYYFIFSITYDVKPDDKPTYYFQKNSILPIIIN